MSAKRIENSPKDQKLKIEAGALVRAVGGVEAAEGFCRSGFRRLSEYGRTDNDCHMPLDVIDDLEDVSHDTPGWPIVTRALCRRRGGVFVPVPQCGASMATSLNEAVARHCKEAAQATARACEALGDGRIDADEAADLLREFDEAVEAAVSAQALLRQLVEARA